jgi:hypothetical protein
MSGHVAMATLCLHKSALGQWAAEIPAVGS